MIDAQFRPLYLHRHMKLWRSRGRQIQIVNLGSVALPIGQAGEVDYALHVEPGVYSARFAIRGLCTVKSLRLNARHETIGTVSRAMCAKGNVENCLFPVVTVLGGFTLPGGPQVSERRKCYNVSHST